MLNRRQPRGLEPIDLNWTAPSYISKFEVPIEKGMHSPVTRTAKKTNRVSWKPFISSAPAINFVVPSRVYLEQTSANNTLWNMGVYISPLTN